VKRVEAKIRDVENNTFGSVIFTSITGIPYR